MDEIIAMYTRVMAGEVNQDIFNFNSINIHFANKILNTYTYHGDMPNRYKLPETVEGFVSLLKEVDKIYEEVMDNNQYVCTKCQETFDLPAAKKNNAGFMACSNCSDGGDIRGKDKPSNKESQIPSTVKPKNMEDAIAMLRQNGYVVKKLLKSYKVVYRDHEGEEIVTKSYYRSKEEFLKKHANVKFISLIKALSDSEEIDL